MVRYLFFTYLHQEGPSYHRDHGQFVPLACSRFRLSYATMQQQKAVSVYLKKVSRYCLCLCMAECCPAKRKDRRGSLQTQTQTQTCLFDIISRNTIYLTCRMICRETPIKTMCRSHRGHPEHLQWHTVKLHI